VSNACCRYLELNSTKLDSGVPDVILPRPKEYKLIAKIDKHQAGNTDSLHIWLPIPTTDNFMALGMLITKNGKPPKYTACRMVPKRWLTPTTLKPKLIWSGPGLNLWQVSNMKLLWATPATSGNSGKEKGAKDSDGLPEQVKVDKDGTPLGPFYEVFKKGGSWFHATDGVYDLR